MSNSLKTVTYLLTLENIRNERDLNYFTKISKCAKFSILQHVTGNLMPIGETYHANNVHDHLKQIFEGLDSIINTAKYKFDQPPIELFSGVEQLFLKSVEKQNVTDELKVLQTHFKDDYDSESLIGEL